MAGKFFAKKRVLIISDDEIKSYPLTPKSQIFVLFAFVSFISWVSFSSGKYFTFKEVITQKEEEVHQANLINLDLQTKIDSLQSNLVKLNQYFDTVKDFDYNKQDQSKKKKDKEISYRVITDPFAKPKLLKRPSTDLKQQVVDDINSNASLRIQEMKKIIALTGLSVSDVDVEALGGQSELVNHVFSGKNQGGPDTSNLSNISFASGENIDDTIRFSENIEQLIYLENMFNSMPFIVPMKRYYISSRYGRRIDPITKRRANHYGTDFAGPIGARIYATAPGVVKFAGRKGNYGKFIEIDHGFDVVTRYGHLSRISVKKGDKILRDQIIGNQGNSGRSSGPHLHYEVRVNGKNYNPEKFIKAGKHVF